jgi:hypothetical protein
MSMQDDADMSADGRWLTYDQLSALRRIDKQSAIKLATRNRWRRRKSNIGQMQVFVPVIWLERAQDRHARYVDISLPGSDGEPAGAAVEAVLAALREAHAREIERLIGVHAGEITRLTEALGRAEARAEAATARADGEHSRADGIAGRAHAVEAELAAIEAVRDVERARAREAEEGRDAARRQVEELRIRLTEVEAEGHSQTVEAAELAAKVRAAETAQAEAEAHAAELRQVDKERRGQGRWARLRAAWRGE